MISIILAGGAGTRLWPVSRKYWPKFLIKFNNKHTFLQSTFLRVNKISSIEDIFIIVNKEHRFLVEENIQDLNINFNKENIIAEPEMKNTLPAISVMAKLVLEKYGDEVMGIFPSDHWIKNETKFVQFVKKAVVVAQRGYIVTFGVVASREETGYGYIKVADKLENYSNVYKVERFIEKPKIETVKKLLKKKNVFWNSGMFILKPSILFEELKKYQPKMYEIIYNWDLKPSSLKEIYSKIENISIDKGLMEKTDKIVVIPLNIFWDDVGNWSAIERIFVADKNKNVIKARSVDIGSKNITVLGDKRIIATAGLNNLIIVDTEDALLVISKKFVEKVRQIVSMLGEKEETVLYHKTTLRPWGFYTVLESKPGYKVKLINVLPHKKLSLQKHNKRIEHWFVVSGKAKVICKNKEYILHPGEDIIIPKKTPHRLENPYNKTTELIEISRGRYIAEDDIIRLQDDYKRTNN